MLRCCDVCSACSEMDGMNVGNLHVLQVAGRNADAAEGDYSKATDKLTVLRSTDKLTLDQNS
jgi:hypothetical protein